MQRFQREINTLIKIATVFLLGALLLSVTGIIKNPLSGRLDLLSSRFFFFWLGTLGTSVVLLHVFSDVNRRSVPIILGAGITVGFISTWFIEYSINPDLILMHEVMRYFACVGVIAFIDLVRLSLAGWKKPPRPDTGSSSLVRVCLYSIAFLLVMDLMGASYLQLVATLHPTTFDAFAYRADHAVFSTASADIIQYYANNSWFANTLSIAYQAVPALVVIHYALQLRQPERSTVNILLVVVVSILAALSVYNLLPVVGPKYAFPENFPLLPDPASVPLVLTPEEIGYRNGIPSMHFGWGLLFLMNARLLKSRWLIVVSVVYALLMVLATVAMGEHYFIDLVPSFPFVLLILSMASHRLAWTDPARLHSAAVGLVVTLLWLAAIRYGTPGIEAYPMLARIVVLGTIGISIYQYLKLERALNALVGVPERLEPIAPTQPMTGKEGRTLVAMFFFSGFAGLIYEVVFSKALALTFGSTALATYTVLATYMGGMAIGAYLGGLFADRVRSPLLAYAVCEGVIGLYAVATPKITELVKTLYVGWAGNLPPDAPELTLFRLGLGMLVMLIPTILMGATLPLLVIDARRREMLPVGGAIGKLYSANTLGAALGALLTGYLIMPALGVKSSLLLAVLLNLLVALAAIDIWKRKAPAEGSVPDMTLDGGAMGTDTSPPIFRYAALAILLVGGAITLAIEVVYIQMLAVVAGNSTYAFSLMLFTFLVGLGAGAASGRRWAKLDSKRLLWLVGVVQAVLGMMVWASLYFWGQIPEYFASFSLVPSHLPFGAREFIRGLVCFMVMVPPAFLIGMSYPLAIDIVGRGRQGSKEIGQAIGLNTLGNILGVVIAGFLLIPAYGSLKTTLILGALALLLAAVAFGATKRFGSFAAMSVAAVIVFTALPPSFDYTALASGANVYFRPQGFGKAIDHVESVDGGLTTVHVSEMSDGGKVKTLLTNGKFQGNDALGGEMVAQMGVSAAPLLHTPGRDKALVIGFGTGVAAYVMAKAGFKQVDIAEISEDILKMSENHFKEVNGDILSKPNVKPYVTDGRNFLLVTDHKYDVIGLEISSIWFAGAASLYNREFYQIAKKRLLPGGVLQQWIQLHHIQPIDILSVLASVRSEFKYVWLYVIGGQGVIIASDTDSSQGVTARINALKEAGFASEHGEQFAEFFYSSLQKFVLPPDAIDRLFARARMGPEVFASTDNNLRLEYSTPRGNAMINGDYQNSIKFLIEHTK